MKKSKGFTLVELMIVIAVIAILATLALTGFRTAQEAARDTQRQQNIKGVQVALECYYSENGVYPDISAAWASLGTTLGACWTGSSLNDKPGGDVVAAGGGVTRGTAADVATYVYSLDGDEDGYEMILNGESKTLTFDSPS